jgi:hypothetical protein
LSYYKRKPVKIAQNEACEPSDTQEATGEAYNRPRRSPCPRKFFPTEVPAELGNLFSQRSSQESQRHSSIRPTKRARKASQLSQIQVYQDQILGPDSSSFALQEKSAPESFEGHSAEVWPKNILNIRIL